MGWSDRYQYPDVVLTDFLNAEQGSAMAIEVAKVILEHVQDASGLEERILAGQFSADEVALGEVSMPKAEQICKDLKLYSSVASCSSGVELEHQGPQGGGPVIAIVDVGE